MRHLCAGANPSPSSGSLRAATCVAALTLALLPGCVQPPPRAEPATPSVAEPAPPARPQIVEICEMFNRVFALRDDGRVMSAKLDEDRFAPPYEALTNIVELSCNFEQVCVRDEQGAIHCIDRQEQVQPVAGLGPAISMQSNCAITREGEFWCWWPGTLVAEPSALPRTSRRYGELELTKLHRIVLSSSANTGCAVQTTGKLWCWAKGDVHYPFDFGEPRWINDHTEERDYAPVVIAEFTNPTDIEKLWLSPDIGVCWRMHGEWTCTNVEQERFPRPPNCEAAGCHCTFPCPNSVCSERPCECRSERRSERYLRRCWKPGEESRELDERWSVPDILSADSNCVLDRDRRVWCQPHWEDVPPPHEVVFEG